MAIQRSTSKPGRPDSATVGTSGYTGLRADPVVAIGRTRLSAVNGTAPAMLENASCTFPLMTSGYAAPMPRYGTCVISMPAASLIISPARWGAVPTPADAKLSLPGLALAQAMNSENVFTGSVNDATITAGEEPTMETACSPLNRS